VNFDISDTNDADDDKLTYAWDFGDGFKNNLANAEHTYLKAGIYKVKLEVSDGQETVIKEKSIKVVNTLEELNSVTEINTLNDDKDNIIINEILPNPKGADTDNEWVELKNQSLASINLLNWRIENSNGKYKFDEAQILEPGTFYVLDNIKSKLAFKNTDDVISLYNDLDELIDRVEYAGAIQGEAYARGANNKWFWTTALTLGQENIISLSDSEVIKKNQVLGVKLNTAGYIETDLEKVRELEIGSLVKVKGTVAVEPGVLGVQIFYIVGSPGMQIYNYKKDFPILKVGDYIEVAGELVQTQGEFRIKTKDKSGINLIEHKDPPVALALKGDEISEENIGQLITITGEITDKKSASLYVDDGSDEVFVYIKQNANIDTKSLAAGQKISIAGILSKAATGLRLLPRCQEDIKTVVLSNSLEPQVLGEVSSAGEWDLAERDKKLELFKYLLIIAGGVIILLGVLFIKAKKRV
jgi:PKD repeat protein